MDKYFDIYIVGIGGQGVLTIADIITLTATRKGIDVNYYPTKGMAQRGGFAKAQLRVGRKPNSFSPSIPEGGADLVVSMELCETLKAIRFAKPNADYVILGSKWLPIDVMLGTSAYPEKEVVLNEIKKASGNYYYVDPETLPKEARPNLFLLGVLFKFSKLSELFSQEDIEETIATRWPKVAASNLKTFHFGLEGMVERI